MVWHAQRFRNQDKSSASFAWGTGEQSCAKAVCGRSVDALEMKKHQRLHSDVATTSCELLLCGFLSSNTPTNTVPRWLVAKDQAFACESKKHRVPPMRQCALRLQRSHRGSHTKRVDTCRQKYQKVSNKKQFVIEILLGLDMLFRFLRFLRFLPTGHTCRGQRQQGPETVRPRQRC